MALASKEHSEKTMERIFVYAQVQRERARLPRGGGMVTATTNSAPVQ